jgi:hypothetical protein
MVEAKFDFAAISHRRFWSLWSTVGTECLIGSTSSNGAGMALSRNSVFFLDFFGQYIHMYIPKNGHPNTSKGLLLVKPIYLVTFTSFLSATTNGREHFPIPTTYTLPNCFSLYLCIPSNICVDDGRCGPARHLL